MIKEVVFNSNKLYKKFSEWSPRVGETYRSHWSNNLLLVVEGGVIFLTGSKTGTIRVTPPNTLADDYTPCDITITVD